MKDKTNISLEKREHPTEKSRLHPRNRHRERYDFVTLVKSHPPLASFVTPNRYGDESIDFADPKAVRALNAALLIHYYDIVDWQLPDGYLCPPIPGRADYIHHIAELLSQKNYDKIPKGDTITILDTGVGASCIYPIIGNKEYGWSFIGSDIDPVAISSAQNIVSKNKSLTGNVELRRQMYPNDIFKSIIQSDESIDLTICNPPFHSSIEEATSGTLRKIKNLNQSSQPLATLNFGGQLTELVCEGGEDTFVQSMIKESKRFQKNVFWFSTLISKQSNLRRAEAAVHKAGALELRIIPMGQGNKTSRILAWSFLSPKEQAEWTKKRFAQHLT
jgi:23S rRNA (adenine1618-N6)-methyltransferase